MPSCLRALRLRAFDDAIISPFYGMIKQHYFLDAASASHMRTYDIITREEAARRQDAAGTAATGGDALITPPPRRADSRRCHSFALQRAAAVCDAPSR